MSTVLTTERLLLRPHSVDDLGGYTELWSTVTPSVPGVPNHPPLDQEQAWARLLRFIGHWAVFRFGPFVVVDRKANAIVGEVGFAHFCRGHGAFFDSCPEAMWKIAPHCQGRGLALEAMQAVTKWFDDQGPARRTVCMIDPGNKASLRIAAHLGFQQFECATYRANPVLLLERLVE